MALSQPARAGYDETHKLTAADTAAGDTFGSAVGISGNTAIVGALGDDDGGSVSGSAYLFDTTTGSQLFKLTASDAAAGDTFGVSVGISGNRAIVGAYQDDDAGSASGSAYLFNTTTGSQIAKLTAADAAAVDFFGFSVGISGNTAIVGAYLDDDAGSESGSAYLFDATTGSQLFKLTASDASAGDRLGFSVAIGGNIAIVGAQGDDDAGSFSGSAYLFDATTGEQLFKLTASDASGGDIFGYSVGISGNTAIVGARFGGSGSGGAAYLFDAATGVQVAKFTASDGADLDVFGTSVAIGGDIAIVGAPGDDGVGSDSGSAYLFGADQLTADPIDGGSIDFTGLAPGADATLDEIISLLNSGVDGTVIEVLGFTFTGDDAALFDLPGFATATLTAGGATDTAAYDLAFLGAPAGGLYTAGLTLHTDSGDVAYALSAEVVPEPAGLTALAAAAAVGLLCRRRR